jgi:hypothetical protein
MINRIGLIVVELKGGLGNQIFQYATARRLSFSMGVPLKLDTTWYDTYKQRTFGLDKFNINAEIATKKDIYHFKSSKWHRRLNMYLLRKYVVERQSKFDPRILGLGKDTYLSGHWQSYRYFEDVPRLIKHELTLKDPLNSLAQRIANEISVNDSVSVHIRRGDYVNDPQMEDLWPDYYRRSILKMAGSVKKPHFYFFSDEQLSQLLIAHQLFEGTQYPAAFVTNTKDYEDLILMSLCKHHIIANSTFSWWGAWLNKQKGITIAPSKWCKDGYDFGPELPGEWLKL